MNAGELIQYCINNPIKGLDDTTNGLRWQFFPDWVKGMDYYIEDILYDSTNMEAICDSMGLYDEEGDWIEYSDLDPQQWYVLYEMFIQHMHFFFEEWEDMGRPHPADKGCWTWPCASMAAHFHECEQDYRSRRC